MVSCELCYFCCPRICSITCEMDKALSVAFILNICTLAQQLFINMGWHGH